MTRLFFLIIFTASPFLVQAQVPEAVQRFDEAMQLYENGEYQNAIAVYEEILATGYTTGPLHYNTGNAYYRIDQYGQALRHWEKARRIMGSGPELDHNIEIIKARIGTPFSVVPDPFWVTWWRTLIVPLGPFFYLSAGLILYFVAALLFGMRIWYRRQGAMLRRVRVGSVILSLLLLATALGISRSGSLISQAVVITDSAKLSEELGVEGRIDVPEGVIVSILAHEETHYKVRIPNGLEGFIPARAVGEI